MFKYFQFNKQIWLVFLSQHNFWREFFTCDQNNMAQKGTLLSYFKKVSKTNEQAPATPKNVLKAKDNKKTSPKGSPGTKKGE